MDAHLYNAHTSQNICEDMPELSDLKPERELLFTLYIHPRKLSIQLVIYNETKIAPRPFFLATSPKIREAGVSITVCNR